MTHAEITYRTKKVLSTALKRRMHTCPFSKITVSDIISDCNLNRNTFYYHFKDMNDLLKWTFEQDTIDILDKMDLLGNPESAVRFVLDYIDDNKFVISCACDSLGRDQLKEFFYNDMKSIVDANLDELEKNSRMPMSSGEKEILSMFFTEGIAGMLLHYINNTKSLTRNDIIKITGQLFTRFMFFITE